MSLMMNEISWVQYQEKIAQNQILIIPIGATEQHGPHLPLGVDAMLAESFAKKLAAKVGGLVAPTISYGYKSLPMSGGGPFFPGTIDLNGSTLIHLVQDIVVEFVKDGWKKIVLFNCHYENEAFVSEGANLAAKEWGNEDHRVFILNWWDNLDQHVVNQVFDEIPFPGWALEHAAISETSLMMYFYPHLVQEDKIPDDKVEEVLAFHSHPPLQGWVPDSGCLHTSRTSTARKGELIVENVLENICNRVLPKFGG